MLDKKISDMIEPTVEALGFELVRVAYGGKSHPVLQIMAEREDGTLSIEDCQAISREISVLLDVENPINSEYSLEVSSPGIDRPLTRLKDFERYKGLDAKIELVSAVDGQRRFRGMLLGIDGQLVILGFEGIEKRFEFDNIKKAKLEMSDALLEASRQAG